MHRRPVPEAHHGVRSELELNLSAGQPQFGFLSERERLWAEVSYTGMTSQAHLVTLVSEKMRAMGVMPSRELAGLQDGVKVWVGGVVVSRQRPPTAKGMAFLALEDEGGLTNVVLRPEVYEADRKALRSVFVVVEGELQRRGGAINVLAKRVIAVKPELG